MSSQELRQMSIEQLETELKQTQKELFQLRFTGATEKLENPNQKKTVRRQIARIKTIITEKTPEQPSEG